MSEDLNDEQVEESRILMRALAEGINELIGGNRFLLLVFPSEGDIEDRMAYASTCSREEALVAMKQITARFEGRMHSGGTTRQ